MRTCSSSSIIECAGERRFGVAPKPVAPYARHRRESVKPKSGQAAAGVEHTMSIRKLGLGLFAVLALAGCQGRPSSTKSVDDAAITRADKDGVNWLSYGRTHDEQRFSPLDKVNDTNVGRLGLAWYADLDTNRGQEATPIEVDGKLYVTTAWSMVKAFDAKTGALLWSYDPQVPREVLIKTCCDAVNRGVAVWHDKVYVATLDGRLVALDAATGKVAWWKTTVDPSSKYVITGAPRIIKGKVIIGSAGAEYIARGFISAYDADTGKQIWRFYTVPGDPSKGFENKAMEAAAKTWKGEWWKLGGGATVWDAISYDSDLDLIFFGTGNAGPWNKSVRSPGGGDNLYASSIVAIRPDTGEYVWHFQETPGDRWDFDATQQIVVATLPIDGRPTKVLLHAPKNGFFYVLDAKTGRFLSGKPFTPIVTWATGLDPVTGRPNVNPAANYDETGKPFISVPGAVGAHSWQPMSFSPKTGLVYIPANEAGFPYAAAPKGWQPKPEGFNTAMDGGLTAMPADPKARAAALAASTGSLIAWDPVKQKAAWRVMHVGPSNGGTLATAGNLVFQGTAAGDFNAYAADSGKQLWTIPVQTGVIAAPMTYSIDGEQYVAVLAGWGGVWDIATGVLADKSGSTRNISRLLVYKIGGVAKLPAPPPLKAMPLDPPPVTAPPAVAAAGGELFGRYCAVCHGDAAVAGGLNPDLRHSGMINTADNFKKVVLGGVFKGQGMVSFANDISPADAESIRAYIIKRANEDKALEMAAAK